MKIAITGCNGRIGRRVVLAARNAGHTVVGIDLAAEPILAGESSRQDVSYRQTDLRDYDQTLAALQGCEAVIHLAACPNPGDYVHASHNNNVVMSWNVLRSAAELGITRVAQASTVNVITLAYSAGSKLDYFPIDEDHPCGPDEPYGLSKQIAELQADTIVRRYPFMRVASLRLHWSIPDKRISRSANPEISKKDLWGWVQEDSGAEAFLLAITCENGKWAGHERFFIAAPDPRVDEDTAVLRERYWPDVPVKEGKDVSGSQGFFDCRKAESLLGWKHSWISGE